MSKKNEEPTDQTTRLLARILRTLLASEPFETLADLVDALKFRCARLRIAYHPDHLDHALRIVGSNHPLTARRHLTAPLEPPSYYRESRTDAVATLERLGITL